MKFRCLVIAFLCVILCGCSDARELPSLSSLEFTAEIRQYDAQYVCDCTVVDEQFVAVVKSPDTLAETTLVFNAGNVVIEHLGLKHEIPMEEFPSNSPILILRKIISQVSSDAEIVEDKKNLVVQGKIDTKNYEFILSPSGLPLSIDYPEADFKATFKNVTVK